MDALRLSTRYLLTWATLAATIWFTHAGTDPGILDNVANMALGWLFGERGAARAIEKHAVPPSWSAWGVDPAKVAKLEADQKKG